jgi:hypothetical protein
MGVAQQMEITLVIENREIVDAYSTSAGVECSDLTAGDHRNFKHSAYGLRRVDTLFETQQTQSDPVCYMVIAGKKFIVPCT